MKGGGEEERTLVGNQDCGELNLKSGDFGLASELTSVSHAFRTEKI